MITNHHTPFPVELNGPAHIAMLIDLAASTGKQPNIDAIRRLADETRAYLLALSNGDLPHWHETRASVSAFPYPTRDEVYRRLVHIHSVDNSGQCDRIISLAADALFNLGVMP